MTIKMIDVITDPYLGATHIKAILKALDEYFHGSGGVSSILGQLLVWDIDSITDSYRIDLLATTLGLYGWDKSWGLDEKKAKIKQGIKIKTKAGTPFAVKEVASFVLDADKFDSVNHPVVMEERYGQRFYDATYLHDGSIDYDSTESWTAFRLIIPYDGSPTTEEINAVIEQVNNYKRLITYMVDIQFVPLQTKYLHSRPQSLVDSDYITIPHDPTLNFPSGDWTLFGRFWYEGFNTANPIIMAKDKVSETQFPYKIWINGTNFDDNLTIDLNDGTSSYSLAGTSLKPNSINNFVITNESGSVTIHQSWANNNESTLGTYSGTKTATGVGVANSTGDLKYLLSSKSSGQVWGYPKDFGGVDRVWTSDEIDDFLNEKDFSSYSLFKTSNLVDGNGNPLNNSNSPLFFHRINEETGTEIKEFQGKTGYDGTLIGGDWDTFLDPFGGLSGIYEHLIAYFRMGEDRTSPVFADSVETDNTYLIESTNNSEDTTTTGRLDKALKNELEYIETLNLNIHTNTTIPTSTFTGNLSICFDAEFSSLINNAALFRSFSTRGFYYSYTTGGLRLYYFSGGTAYSYVTTLLPITGVRYIITFRKNGNNAYFTMNTATDSKVLVGNFDAPLTNQASLMGVLAATTLVNEGKIHRVFVTADDIGAAGVTAFEQGLEPTTTALIFKTDGSEYSGGAIIDQSGNGYDFSSNGANTSVKGLSSELTMRLPNSKTINSSWCKGFWFKYANATYRNGNRIFYDSRDIKQANKPGIYVVTAATGELEVYKIYGSSWWKIKTTSPVADTDPHLLMFEDSGSGSSSGFKVYLDGVDQGAGSTSGSLTQWEESDKPRLLTPDTIQTVDYYAPDLEYLDSIMEFDNILTSTEHQTLYNSGWGLKYKEID